MSITEKMDEIQGRADVATEGPWIKCGGGVTLEPHRDYWEWISNRDYPKLDADQDFITKARTDVPNLVNALRFAHRQFLLAAENYPNPAGAVATFERYLESILTKE